MFKPTQLLTLTGTFRIVVFIPRYNFPKESLDVVASNDSPPLVCVVEGHNTGHFNEEEWPQFSET